MTVAVMRRVMTVAAELVMHVLDKGETYEWHQEYFTALDPGLPVSGGRLVRGACGRLGIAPDKDEEIRFIPDGYLMLAGGRISQAPVPRPPAHARLPERNGELERKVTALTRERDMLRRALSTGTQTEPAIAGRDPLWHACGAVCLGRARRLTAPGSG